MGPSGPFIFCLKIICPFNGNGRTPKIGLRVREKNMLYASGNSEIKRDIINAILEKEDDEDIMIIVHLAPWASTSEFNDMMFFGSVYATQKNVTIRIRRQSWVEFIKNSIMH